MKANKTFLFVLFILVISFSSFTNEGNYKTKDKFVVVLDAGHGGKDPGNLGNGYKEKDIALEVVLAVGEILEKEPNVEVIYTRKTDKFVDLFVRGKIANKAKADLFISVHCDSHHSEAYGAGTFVLGLHRNKTNFEVAKKENAVIFLEDEYKKNYNGFDPNSPESAISILLGQEEYLDQSIYLASLIQNNFVNMLKRKDRKVKQAGFIVLHQTVMPSVLIELGFLTNKKEGAYLNSAKGQKEMSRSISNAILKYKDVIESNITDENLVVSHSETTTEDYKAISIAETKVYEGISFKVQIAASSKKTETKPYNFNGLEDITILKEGDLYKYFYGNTSDYNKIRRMANTAKEKGYSNCFVVAFKNDKKIPLAEALKTVYN